jgi:single-strand DNA-binding protein
MTDSPRREHHREEQTMNDRHDPITSCNVAVIRGDVHGEPNLRDLPTGGVVAQFDVTTRLQTDGRESNISVPIAWSDPTAAQLGVLVPGAEVVVVGTVRRRFFRVGGATQSRTEVVADTVVPIRRRKQVAASLRMAADRVLDTA